MLYQSLFYTYMRNIYLQTLLVNDSLKKEEEIVRTTYTYILDTNFTGEIGGSIQLSSPV